MSRTDAHAPLRVRLARGELAAEACHAAGHADCDLPSRPPFAGGSAGHYATKCRWVFRYTGIGACSRWKCHGGEEDRRENRTQRRRDHVMLRNVQRAWLGGDTYAFDDDPNGHARQRSGLPW